MYPISVRTWYTCVLESCIPAKKDVFPVELCEIIHADGLWHIITYYDGKDVYAGTLNDCFHWINSHYVNRRYCGND